MPCVLVPTAIVLSLVCEAECGRHFISVIGLNIIVKGTYLGAQLDPDTCD